jgi:hypothetical protein
MTRESEDCTAADDCGKPDAEAETGVKINVEVVSERFFKNLPPPVRQRLERIIREHGKRMLSDRYCVVHERRGDGRRYWRLYIEEYSGEERERTRAGAGRHLCPDWHPR